MAFATIDIAGRLELEIDFYLDTFFMQKEMWHETSNTCPYHPSSGCLHYHNQLNI